MLYFELASYIIFIIKLINKNFKTLFQFRKLCNNANIYSFQVHRLYERAD